MPQAPFPGVEVRHRGGHYAVLDPGAHVLAWTPPGQTPVLWVSPVAVFEPGVAVRGGVPVVFPWFGAGVTGDRKPSHGFARTATWRRSQVADELATNGRLEVHHTLDATGFESEPFTAELVSEFTPTKLTVSLIVTNTGTTDFTYEEALHTYLGVRDVGKISLEGLSGCRYVDKVTGVTNTQQGLVRLDGETDRIYEHTGDVVVDDAERGRRILVTKTGSANTVVWNPGQALGARMADVGTKWRKFVCVEAANVGASAITIAPGDSHTLSQSIQLARPGPKPA